MLPPPPPNCSIFEFFQFHVIGMVVQIIEIPAKPFRSLRVSIAIRSQNMWTVKGLTGCI